MKYELKGEVRMEEKQRKYLVLEETLQYEKVMVALKQEKGVGGDKVNLGT